MHRCVGAPSSDSPRLLGRRKADLVLPVVVNNAAHWHRYDAESWAGPPDSGDLPLIGERGCRCGADLSRLLSATATNPWVATPLSSRAGNLSRIAAEFWANHSPFASTLADIRRSGMCQELPVALVFDAVLLLEVGVADRFRMLGF